MISLWGMPAVGYRAEQIPQQACPHVTHWFLPFDPMEEDCGIGFVCSILGVLPHNATIKLMPANSVAGS